MASLFDYTKSVMRLIRDANSEKIDFQDLIYYVNKARRMVARRTQCLRFLTPISSSIMSCTLKTGGSSYSSRTAVVISPPDFPSGDGPAPNGAQATAAFTITRGVITDCEITFGGYGYYQPAMSFTDTTGSGATIIPNLAYINTLNLGQEVYNFNSVDMSTAPPGYGPIFAIFSVAVIFSDYRYAVPMYDFTHYQALIRNYAFQFQYVPGIGSQYRRGTGGNFYFYPQPNQTYQMEWDCICDPQDINFNEDVEAIPDVWTDAVEFYAASLAFAELQNLNASKYYEERFERIVGVFSKAANPSRPINPYGRR